MPNRQKIMLIVLALALAYAAYDLLPGDDSGDPGTTGDFQPGRPQATQNQSQSQAQVQAANSAQGQVSQAGQETGIFQPPPNLELRDDPFSRPPSLKPVVDPQAQSSALSGLTFHGIFGNSAMINDNPYQVNDTIMGFTVIEYTSERVVLRDPEGKTHVLRNN